MSSQATQMGATSISAQPSLPSLPSLNTRDSSVLALCQCISTLGGHSSYVSALALHDSHLCSGSADQHIRIWTPHVESSSHAVVMCRSPIKSLLISGDTVFSSHLDYKIRVWHLNDHKEQNLRCRLQAVLPTAKDRILSLLSPSKYAQVRRHKKCTWVQHVDAVSALAISDNGSLLYSVSWDRTIKIWRCSDFKCVESVAGAHHDAINAIVVSKDGFVYTGSADKTIKVWKKHPGQKNHSLVDTLERHQSAVNALALSCDESVLYSGACDRSVGVWEGRSGQMEAVGALRGHTGAVLCLSVTGELVCSGSADRTVRAWRRRGGESGGGYTCLAVLEGHGGPVKSLAMVVGGGEAISEEYNTCLVYSGSLDCDIKMWKILVPILHEDA